MLFSIVLMKISPLTKVIRMQKVRTLMLLKTYVLAPSEGFIVRYLNKIFTINTSLQPIINAAANQQQIFIGLDSEWDVDVDARTGKTVGPSCIALKKPYTCVTCLLL